jgi:hypothetical protein
MSTPPLVLLLQRDFGQKINITFEFVTKNFSVLLKCMLLIVGPPALLAGIAQGVFQSQLISSGVGKNSVEALYQYISPEYFLVMVFSVITYFLGSAATSAFMILYEQKGIGSDITPGEVWQKIQQNLSGAVSAQLLFILVFILGFLFFIIPGIYLGITMQLFMMVIFRERLSATESLKRSHQLVQGKWWSTFGLIFVMSIIAGIISIVFQFPLIITSVLNLLGLGEGISDSQVVTIVVTTISIVGSNLVQCLIWLAIGFQYYNLVERRDGSGLRAEIDELGNGDVMRHTEDF